VVAQDSIHYSDTKGKNLFAIRVADKSMTPLFEVGDYAIINPNVPTAVGALVAVRMLKGKSVGNLPSDRLPGDRLIVRVLEESGEGLWARPLDLRWNAIKVGIEIPGGISSKEKVVGEVIGRVVERKRIYV